jgi:hypothetical protein
MSMGDTEEYRDEPAVEEKLPSVAEGWKVLWATLQSPSTLQFSVGEMIP